MRKWYHRLNLLTTVLGEEEGSSSCLANFRRRFILAAAETFCSPFARGEFAISTTSFDSGRGSETPIAPTSSTLFSATEDSGEPPSFPERRGTRQMKKERGALLEMRIAAVGKIVT